MCVHFSKMANISIRVGVPIMQRLRIIIRLCYMGVGVEVEMNFKNKLMH